MLYAICEDDLLLDAIFSPSLSASLVPQTLLAGAGPIQFKRIQMNTHFF